jgi:hypothetical protein
MKRAAAYDGVETRVAEGQRLDPRTSEMQIRNTLRRRIDDPLAEHPAGNVDPPNLPRRRRDFSTEGAGAAGDIENAPADGVEDVRNRGNQPRQQWRPKSAVDLHDDRVPDLRLVEASHLVDEPHTAELRIGAYGQLSSNEFRNVIYDRNEAVAGRAAQSAIHFDERGLAARAGK